MDWTEALNKPSGAEIDKAWKEGYEQGFIDAKAVEEVEDDGDVS